MSDVCHHLQCVDCPYPLFSCKTLGRGFDEMDLVSILSALFQSIMVTGVCCRKMGEIEASVEETLPRFVAFSICLFKSRGVDLEIIRIPFQILRRICNTQGNVFLGGDLSNFELFQ